MGSEYEVDDDKVFDGILGSLEQFLQKNPPGTMIEHSGVRMKVTAASECRRSDREHSCELELQSGEGGYANIGARTLFELRDDAVERINTVKISGADFPFPLEFLVAKDEIGIPVVESQDWCIAGASKPLGEFCSKRRW